MLDLNCETIQDGNIALSKRERAQGLRQTGRSQHSEAFAYSQSLRASMNDASMQLVQAPAVVSEHTAIVAQAQAATFEGQLQDYVPSATSTDPCATDQYLWTLQACDAAPPNKALLPSDRELQLATRLVMPSMPDARLFATRQL